MERSWFKITENYVLEHIEEVGGYVLYSTYDKYTISFKYYDE